MSERKYLGQFPIEIKDSLYKDWTPNDWALHCIERYGQIDGEHHKQWVLDQVVRIMKNTPIIIVIAKWSDGLEELRFWTGEPSEEYKKWVEEMKCGGEYSYDEGIAP